MAELHVEFLKAARPGGWVIGDSYECVGRKRLRVAVGSAFESRSGRIGSEITYGDLDPFVQSICFNLSQRKNIWYRKTVELL